MLEFVEDFVARNEGDVGITPEMDYSREPMDCVLLWRKNRPARFSQDEAGSRFAEVFDRQGLVDGKFCRFTSPEYDGYYAWAYQK